MDTFYATDQSHHPLRLYRRHWFRPCRLCCRQFDSYSRYITVKGTRNKDEIGKNRVYAREIVNLYKSKNEVETFKGNTVSDLLSGMSGVYSGALDPNIRGVQ